MVKLTKEERIERAHKLHTGVVENEKLKRALVADSAKKLYSILSDKLYKEILGDDNGQFVSYLADTSIYYTRNQVINLINVYKKFELDLDIPLIDILDIPLSRLIDILPVKFKNKDDCLELLSYARTNIPRDWNITIREKKGLITADTCKHTFKSFEICSICGDRHKI